MENTLGLGCHEDDDQGWEPTTGILILPLCPTIRPQRSPQPPPRTSGPLTSSSPSQCRRARSQVQHRVVGTGTTPSGTSPPLGASTDKIPPGEVRMPSGKTARPSITDNKDGTVTVHYAPSEKGLHEMDIRYDGNHIPGESRDTGDTGRWLQKVDTTMPCLDSCGSGMQHGVECPCGVSLWLVTLRLGGPLGSLTIVPCVPRESPPVLRGCHQPTPCQCLWTWAEPWDGQQAVHIHHCHQGCWRG